MVNRERRDSGDDVETRGNAAVPERNDELRWQAINKYTEPMKRKSKRDRLIHGSLYMIQ